MYATMRTFAAEIFYDEIRLRLGLHLEEVRRFYDAVGYERGTASNIFKRAMAGSATGKR